MNRRLIGLIATVCLASACKDEPVGKMEPIPRPPGMSDAPAQAEAPKPTPAPEPKPDPSKVVLRWKLDAPTAFRLTTTSDSAPAPAPRGKKGKGAREAAPAAASPRQMTSIFVLQKTEAGDFIFRIVPEGPGGEADQGTMSERGFVLDGLSGPLRTTAALVLELPRDPVGPNATWALGTDLVDLGSVPQFMEQKADRHNEVKLTALIPAENGEQVATLEYDLSETVSGQLRSTAPTAPAPKGDKGKDKDEEAPRKSGTQPASAQVRVKGRGEFLVKAGRWRSWEGTLTTNTEGALPGVAKTGERTLRLTPLESVPPELLQPQAKK